MDMKELTSKTEGVLSNIFNTLSGKNGFGAALFGWGALCILGVAFMPPADAILSAINIASAAVCVLGSYISAEDNKRAERAGRDKDALRQSTNADYPVPRRI